MRGGLNRTFDGWPKQMLMRIERKEQAQSVGEQQNDGNCDRQPGIAFIRARVCQAVIGRRNNQRHRGQRQHHGAHTRGRDIKRLHLMAQTARQHGASQHQQNVPNDGAGQGSLGYRA